MPSLPSSRLHLFFALLTVLTVVQCAVSLLTDVTRLARGQMELIVEREPASR